jgi:hypothetical protein
MALSLDPRHTDTVESLKRHVAVSFIPSRTQTADSTVAWTPEPGTSPRPFGGVCRWRFEVGPGQ